ncbi:MAG TPA: NfeD family protein [Acidimicrobiia bacterium]|nr:NfeD family protein [Acidimicrobiia bacterium]
MNQEVTHLVDDCARYWSETGVPRKQVAEMRLELSHHLAEAAAAGQRPASVVGPDLADFAEAWAAEHRRPATSTPTWEDVMSGKTERDRAIRREMLAFGAGTVAIVAAVAVAGKGADTVESELWRWLWTGLAVAMGIGEIFTAGFFLLPFAIGAATAAVLAWLGAGVLAQWLVFFGVSAVALAYLRRYIDRQDEAFQPRVGANRWVGAEGIVLEEIDPDTATGMVRVDNEEWRATSRHGQIIPPGARIAVRDVHGARLIVEQVEH